MKNKILHTGRTLPLYLAILPLFFVLHGFRVNYDFVPVADAFRLTSIYLTASVTLFLLAWWFFKNIRCAGLLAFFLMAYHFFFGSLHDSLKELFPGMLLSRYSFILPASFIIFVLLVAWLKKKKPGLERVTLYLNVLLLTLFFIDLASLGFTVLRENKTEEVALPQGFRTCDSCTKPDIYLIIADEYAGNTELKEVFNFDNSEFNSQLARRGFHTIPYSFSNYNYTPFSVSSILNMEYLQLRDKNRSQPDITYSFDRIRDNQLLRFVQHHGYEYYNYSFFDFRGQPARVRENFLPAKTRLITSQTFLSRLDRDLRFHLVTSLKSEKEIKWRVYANRANNENILDLSFKKTAQRTRGPKFIFTHLMMPHYPYYYDRNGKELPFELLTEGNQVNKKDYIEYLQYCNKIFLNFIDHILNNSAKPPVIIFMGDHGFRHFTEPVSEHYHFLNQVSVHLPGKNYSQFSDSLSAVNLWRTVLNTSFGQTLPMLKDSTIYLAD